ncbi:MAG TPA: DUF402 domain-containing protein [Mycobacteriales bacterium]|nr:DUF402 domain-containing protein [Mycobacteriales bacterium]
MTDVDVVFSKYDGALHWNLKGYRLGEDEHGVWVGMPAGTSGRRGYEPPIVWPEAQVMLFPRDSWWVATFNAAPARIELYCDISTVPEWTDGTVTMVDLDLDVYRRRGGPVEIDDEDEFAEHQVRYGYPPDVIATAQHSCDRLADAVRGGAEPFAGRYQHWLHRVTAEEFQ